MLRKQVFRRKAGLTPSLLRFFIPGKQTSPLTVKKQTERWFSSYIPSPRENCKRIRLYANELADIYLREGKNWGSVEQHG